jgi:uncharacterized membrane protein (UPF0127 family)
LWVSCLRLDSEVIVNCTRNVAAACAAALYFLLASSCTGSGSSPAPEKNSGAYRSGRPQSGLATATLRSGGVEILVELAVSPTEQETGLMHRKAIADGRGMLFVYGEDRRLSFWMKNTLVPLSIAYLGADGVIKEIHDMEPLSLAPVESSRYVRHALEAPRGWFGRVGLRVGDRFDLSGVPGAR